MNAATKEEMYGKRKAYLPQSARGGAQQRARANDTSVSQFRVLLRLGSRCSGFARNLPKDLESPGNSLDLIDFLREEISREWPDSRKSVC